YATRAYRGDFALVTGALNAPDGVNLLGNASLIGLGLLFAPLTLALGAPATFAVVTGFNLAATGAGWYLVFARTLRMHRLAALVGLAFAATARPAPRALLSTLGAGLGIGAAVAVALLAYPLWVQFKGPQSAHGGVFAPRFYSADLAGFAAISPLSLAGGDGSAG